MAFTIRKTNDLYGILLMLLALPLIATANVDCNGKPFHCVNSTHFMICVDLGGGVSSTIDNFLIPCPPTTVCQGNNRFECEFPTVSTQPPITQPLEITTVLTTIIDEATTSFQATDVTSQASLPSEIVTIPFEDFYSTLSTSTPQSELRPLITTEATDLPITDVFENYNISTFGSHANLETVESTYQEFTTEAQILSTELLNTDPPANLVKQTISVDIVSAATTTDTPTTVVSEVNTQTAEFTAITHDTTLQTTQSSNQVEISNTTQKIEATTLNNNNFNVIEGNVTEKEQLNTDIVNNFQSTENYATVQTSVTTATNDFNSIVTESTIEYTTETLLPSPEVKNKSLPVISEIVTQTAESSTTSGSENLLTQFNVDTGILDLTTESKADLSQGMITTNSLTTEQRTFATEEDMTTVDTTNLLETTTPIAITESGILNLGTLPVSTVIVNNLENTPTTDKADITPLTETNSTEIFAATESLLVPNNSSPLTEPVPVIQSSTIYESITVSTESLMDLIESTKGSDIININNEEIPLQSFLGVITNATEKPVDLNYNNTQTNAPLLGDKIANTDIANESVVSDAKGLVQNETTEFIINVTENPSNLNKYNDTQTNASSLEDIKANIYTGNKSVVFDTKGLVQNETSELIINATENPSNLNKNNDTQSNASLLDDIKANIDTGNETVVPDSEGLVQNETPELIINITENPSNLNKNNETKTTVPSLDDNKANTTIENESIVPDSKNLVQNETSEGKLTSTPLEIFVTSENTNIVELNSATKSLDSTTETIEMSTLTDVYVKTESFNLSPIHILSNKTTRFEHNEYVTKPVYISDPQDKIVIGDGINNIARPSSTTPFYEVTTETEKPLTEQYTKTDVLDMDSSNIRNNKSTTPEFMGLVKYNTSVVEDIRSVTEETVSDNGNINSAMQTLDTTTETLQQSTLVEINAKTEPLNITPANTLENISTTPRETLVTSENSYNTGFNSSTPTIDIATENTLQSSSVKTYLLGNSTSDDKMKDKTNKPLQENKSTIHIAIDEIAKTNAEPPLNETITLGETNTITTMTLQNTTEKQLESTTATVIVTSETINNIESSTIGEPAVPSENNASSNLPNDSTSHASNFTNQITNPKFSPEGNSLIPTEFTTSTVIESVPNAHTENNAIDIVEYSSTKLPGSNIPLNLDPTLLTVEDHHTTVSVSAINNSYKTMLPTTGDNIASPESPMATMPYMYPNLDDIKQSTISNAEIQQVATTTLPITNKQETGLTNNKRDISGNIDNVQIVPALSEQIVDSKQYNFNLATDVIPTTADIVNEVVREDIAVQDNNSVRLGGVSPITNLEIALHNTKPVESYTTGATASNPEISNNPLLVNELDSKEPNHQIGGSLNTNADSIQLSNGSQGAIVKIPNLFMTDKDEPLKLDKVNEGLATTITQEYSDLNMTNSLNVNNAVTVSSGQTNSTENNILNSSPATKVETVTENTIKLSSKVDIENNLNKDNPTSAIYSSVVSLAPKVIDGISKLDAKDIIVKNEGNSVNKPTEKMSHFEKHILSNTFTTNKKQEVAQISDNRPVLQADIQDKPRKVVSTDIIPSIDETTHNILKINNIEVITTESTKEPLSPLYYPTIPEVNKRDVIETSRPAFEIRTEDVLGVATHVKNLQENPPTIAPTSSISYTIPVKVTLHNGVNTTPRSVPTTAVNNFICKPNVRGRFADNHDCRKFYICIGKTQPMEGICPVNTVFSEIRKQCTKNLSHCVRNNQFQCVSEGRFSDFLNDNFYYICVKNKLSTFIRFKLRCQNGYHLNKTSVRCVLNTETSQSVSSDKSTSDQSGALAKIEKKQDSEDFECEEEGKFPDPNNCRIYYVCKINNKSEFRRKKKKCDSDEYFHKYKKKCVDSESYECN